eukprot:TRINITY_DN124_c0_g1_i1.p2 TRINITY_DN124_c0_g1~~TRINITY_DN124_c0_g1_i1.p2  ORF type:complete len:773 (-),score=79.36 TRINITY_DN124_c0_g1_i1:1080-3191(-)
MLTAAARKRRSLGAAAAAAVVAEATLPPWQSKPDFPAPAPGVGSPAPRDAMAQADPNPGVPPSVQVRRHLEEWRRIGASPWVVDTLAQGIYLPWVSTPPRHRSKGYRVAGEDEEFLRKELTRGLLRGFYRELTEGEAEQAHCVVGAFVVRSAGKLRMVVDYRLPNRHLAERRFKYETLFDLAPQLRPGDSLLSWDIADAFFHLEIRPQDRKFLCFTALGRVFEPVTMPFGLRLAPYYWTKVCRPVVAELRRLGFRIIAYVDDFGGAPPSEAGKPATKDDAVAGGLVVRSLLARLGLTLHPKKGVWDGPVSLPLLGHVVDTQRGLFVLKPDRAEKIMKAAAALIGRASRNRRWVKAPALRRFCGLAVSSSLSVVSARYHLRCLYSSLGGAKTGGVRLDHQGMRDLAWWSDLTRHAGLARALWPPEPSHTLHTDASLSGWGAVLDGTMPAKGFHAPRYRGRHINLLELVTVRLGLQSFRRFLARRDTWLLLKSDSTVAVGAINAMSSRSPVIMQELRNLHDLCRTWGVSIRAEHLPSAVNAYADRLSREGDSTDWSVEASTFLQLDKMFGPHTTDWFASHLNARCPRFLSKDWTPGCAGVNALRHNWRRENGWANPPFNLMPAVVDKAVRDGAALTLVAPRWRAQPWYWRAVEECTHHFPLPADAALFTHGTRSTPAPKPNWGVDVFRFERRATPPPLPQSALSA